MSVKTEAGQRVRLLQLLISEYKDAQNRGQPVPPDVRELIAHTTGRAARKPAEFQQMLKDLDAIEAATEGGEPFWRTHAANYAFASKHVHPSFYGPVSSGGKIAPDEAACLNALVFGHQYLALSGASCAMIADNDQLRHRIEQRYGDIAPLRRREEAALVAAR